MPLNLQSHFTQAIRYARSAAGDAVGRFAPDDYRLGIVIYYTALVGAAGHLAFIGLFAWLGVRPMALINVGSVGIFLVCFWINRRGAPHAALLLGTFEVVGHALLAVVFVGWASGFHYYIVGLTPLVFYSPTWRTSTKGLIASLLCGLYLALFFYSLAAPPWVPIAPARLGVVGAVNIVTMFIVFAALAYYYRQAATSAEGALRQANQQLEQQAHTDPLTHLANRRDMQVSLDAALKAFHRSGQPLSVVMGDVDHFKAYNDRYGHDAGDQALVKTAELLRADLRDQDRVARWGGEEFLLLLPGARLAEARRVAERLCERLAALRLDYGGEPHGLTMTFGVAEYTGRGGLESCLQAADQALYAGKRRGRNCVVTQPDAATPTGSPTG